MTHIYYIVVILLSSIGLSATSFARSEKSQTLYLYDTSVPEIGVSTKGTALSFPLKPTKVVLGQHGTFGIEYVESDLVITPLFRGARSSLFVYVFGRRFAFDLYNSKTKYPISIYVIRDSIRPSFLSSRTRPSSNRRKKKRGRK